jgi:hypothetical protein
MSHRDAFQSSVDRDPQAATQPPDAAEASPDRRALLKRIASAAALPAVSAAFIASDATDAFAS